MRFGYYFTVGPEVSRGVVRLRFPYSKSINEELKPVPGCRYAPELGRGVWVGPREMVSFYRGIAERHKLEYQEEDLRPQIHETQTLYYSDDAMPHMKQAIRKALAQRSLLYSFEMRLRKTATAIYTLREAGIEDQILIVCPASVRRHWLKELELRWPSHPEALLMEPGIEWEASPVTVVSYELLHKVPTEPWQAIVIDEAHHISGYDGREGRGSRRTRGTIRAERTVELAARNPDALRLALTGTPIRTEVVGLYPIWEFLFPSAMQNKFAFCHRYAGKVENPWRTGKYPYDWKGTDKEHIAELRERLDWISVRAVKQDFQHLLPPLETQVIQLDASAKNLDPRKTIKAFMKGKGAVSIDDIVRQHSAAKIKQATEHVLQAAENGRVVVLSYFHSTAQALRTAITSKNKDIYVDVIKGDVSTKKRAERIEKLAAQERSIMIATLRSVEEGIDLSAFTQVYYVELYPSPGTMEQSTSRYQKMGNTEPISINFLVLAGSAEERMADRLKKRLDDNEGVYASSGAAEHMKGAMESDVMDDDDFKAYLRDLSKQVSEEEEE